MQGLAFRAWEGSKYISVHEIMMLIFPLVSDTHWEVDLDELAEGPGSKEFEDLASRSLHVPVSSGEIAHSSLGVQVTDGRFTGFRHDGETGQPVIVIKATDSTDWDVASTDTRILLLLRARFVDAIELDEGSPIDPA